MTLSIVIASHIAGFVDWVQCTFKQNSSSQSIIWIYFDN